MFKQAIKPCVKRRFTIATIQGPVEPAVKRGRVDSTTEDKETLDVANAINGMRDMQVD